MRPQELRLGKRDRLRKVDIPRRAIITKKILGPELWSGPRIYSVHDWLQVRV